MSKPMSTGDTAATRPLRKAWVLVLALAGIFSILSVGAPSAVAQTAVTGIPSADPRSDGQVRFWDFPLTSAGGAAARAWVHDRNKCGDAFCTIQRLSNAYRVFSLSGCDTFDLYGFTGYFDAHNHGSLTVHFLDSRDAVIGRYAGGRPDPVRWDPVYAVRTCNRS